ncbi:hypothetical protein JHK84_033703 [Glycine max]|nr:hypothetical protein JHK84_033703 [Glycine max]
MAAANAPIAMREALTVWSMDGLSDNMTMPINLKAKVVVAAHDKDINSVAVAPNDSLVCSGSQDHTTCVWRLPDLVSVVVFKGHKRGIWSVEFSPVDQCVVTASGDKTIRIWAISDGSCLKTFKGHTSSVLRALFVTRGTQIVSCGMRLSVADFVLYNILVVEKARIRRIIEAEGNHTLTCVVMPLLEEGVVKGQELENVVSDADYTKAIQIAFELRRPHRLFELFAELCRINPHLSILIWPEKNSANEITIEEEKWFILRVSGWGLGLEVYFEGSWFLFRVPGCGFGLVVSFAGSWLGFRVRGFFCGFVAGLSGSRFILRVRGLFFGFLAAGSGSWLGFRVRGFFFGFVAGVSGSRFLFRVLGFFFGFLAAGSGSWLGFRVRGFFFGSWLGFRVRGFFCGFVAGVSGSRFLLRVPGFFFGLLAAGSGSWLGFRVRGFFFWVGFMN